MFLLLVSLASALCLSCEEKEDLEEVAVGFEAGFVPQERGAGVTQRFVSLQEVETTGQRLVLDVVVAEVSEPVSGIAIKLTYPKEISKFAACSDGELFDQGTCYFAEPGEGSGEVFIGRSITAPEQPVAVSGSKIIVRIELIVFAAGSGEIRFEAQNLGGGDATALLDGNGDPILVTWFAGSITGS